MPITVGLCGRYPGYDYCPEDKDSITDPVCKGCVWFQLLEDYKDWVPCQRDADGEEEE